MQEMRPTIFLIPTLAVALFAGEKGTFAQQYYGPPSVYYGQHEAEEAWEQRGIYDGMEGAKCDFGNNRRPNVNNREEYRDPDSIPGWARHEYREGFRRGYYFRVRQIYYGEGVRDGYRYWHDPR
jgi:hypothetical protein